MVFLTPPPYLYGLPQVKGPRESSRRGTHGLAPPGLPSLGWDTDQGAGGKGVPVRRNRPLPSAAWQRPRCPGTPAARLVLVHSALRL